MLTHTVAYIFDEYLKWWFYLCIIIMAFYLFFKRVFLFFNESLKSNKKNYDLVKIKLNIAIIIYIVYIVTVPMLELWDMIVYPSTATRDVESYSNNLKIFPIIIYTIGLFKKINKLYGRKQIKFFLTNLYSYLKLSLLAAFFIYIIAYYHYNKSAIINKTIKKEYVLENEKWNNYARDIFYIPLEGDHFFDIHEKELSIPWSATKDEVKKIINATLISETDDALTYFYTFFDDNWKSDDVIVTYYFNQNERFYKLVTRSDITNFKANKDYITYSFKDNSFEKEFQNARFILKDNKNEYLNLIINDFNKKIDNKEEPISIHLDENLLKNLYEGKGILYSVEGLPDQHSPYSEYSKIYKDFYKIFIIKTKDSTKEELVLEKIFYNPISESR